MTDQNLGSVVPSGNAETPTKKLEAETPKKKKRKRRRPRKRKDQPKPTESKTNGRSNGSSQWEETAKELANELEALQEEHAQLQRAYKELEAAGLSSREAVQLRRLKHLHGRVINAQVCEKCKPAMDSIQEDAKWIK